MRHGGRALLAGREELFYFQDLGALQVADFGRQPFERTRDHGKDRKEHRVPVARDDLRRDRFGCQPHLLRDMLLDLGVDIGEGTDGARNGASRHFHAGESETLLGAHEFGIGKSELYPEGRRLRMDAMASADGERIPVLLGPALESFEQIIEIGDKEGGGAA